MKKTSVILASVLVSGVAFAEGTTTTTATAASGSTFNNHLNSTLMVSPAQLYQVEAMRSDLQFGFSNDTTEAKADGGKTTGSTVGNELNVAAIYNIQGAGARVGLKLDYGTNKIESKVTGGNTAKTDGSVLTFAPVASYTIADAVVVGAAVNMMNMTTKSEGAKEAKTTYTAFQPGVLYKNTQLEAGLTFVPAGKATTKQDGADDVKSDIAANTVVHGRYAINNDMAAGGIITNSGITKDEKDTEVATNDVAGTFEYGMNAMKFEGNVGLTTAGYKKKENMSTDNISTMHLGGAADYAVNSATVVGGGLTYAWGSEKNAGVTHAKNDLGVALRGKMTF